MSKRDKPEFARRYLLFQLLIGVVPEYGKEKGEETLVYWSALITRPIIRMKFVEYLSRPKGIQGNYVLPSDSIYEKDKSLTDWVLYCM
jgi:hypothetical protein